MSEDTNERMLGRYQPKNLREVFAMQLAERLQDEEKLTAYLDLLGTYPVPFLLDVFEVAKETAETPEALRKRFWTILGDDPDWRMHD